MKLRNKAAVLAVASTSLLSIPIAAGAATTHESGRAATAAAKSAPATSFNKIPVTGTAPGGKSFTGHMTVSQFVTKGGKTYAVGTLTGKLGNRTIKSTQVSVPASVGQASTSGTSSSSSQMHTDQASCPVLNLILGPLHLNLLGLHVDLNQVVLNITAVPGAGQLLGNLLCGISNLLNGSGASSVTGANLTGVLNIVEQLANTPSLASL
jgi:hypothetical protein